MPDKELMEYMQKHIDQGFKDIRGELQWIKKTMDTRMPSIESVETLKHEQERLRAQVERHKKWMWLATGGVMLAAFMIGALAKLPLTLN